TSRPPIRCSDRWAAAQPRSRGSFRWTSSSLARAFRSRKGEAPARTLGARAVPHYTTRDTAYRRSARKPLVLSQGLNGCPCLISTIAQACVVGHVCTLPTESHLGVPS